MNRLLVINLSAVRIEAVALKRCVGDFRYTCNTGRARLVSRQLSGVKKGEVKMLFPPFSSGEQVFCKISSFYKSVKNAVRKHLLRRLRHRIKFHHTLSCFLF